MTDEFDTTILVKNTTRSTLNGLKIHPRESYNDVILKLLKKKEVEP